MAKVIADDDELHPETIRMIAADIAGPLARMIDDFCNETSPRRRQRKALMLRTFLWDNKVGILRVLEIAAARD